MKITVRTTPVYQLALTLEELRYLHHVLGLRSTFEDKKDGFNTEVTDLMYGTIGAKL